MPLGIAGHPDPDGEGGEEEGEQVSGSKAPARPDVAGIGHHTGLYSDFYTGHPL